MSEATKSLGLSIEYTKLAEAREYRETLALVNKESKGEVNISNDVVANHVGDFKTLSGIISQILECLVVN